MSDLKNVGISVGGRSAGKNTKLIFELKQRVKSQQQRIEALSRVASEARGLLDSIQNGSLSRNNCENLAMELIEDIDKALTNTTKAETNNEDQNSS